MCSPPSVDLGQLNDTELQARIHDGDRSAFAVLFGRYRRSFEDHALDLSCDVNNALAELLDRLHQRLAKDDKCKIDISEWGRRVLKDFASEHPLRLPFRGGNVDALTALWVRNREDFLAQLRHQFGISGLEAENLVDELRSKLFEIRDSYDHRRSWKGWASRVLRNHAIDRFRKKTRVGYLITPKTIRLLRDDGVSDVALEKLAHASRNDSPKGTGHRIQSKKNFVSHLIQHLSPSEFENFHVKIIEHSRHVHGAESLCSRHEDELEGPVSSDPLNEVLRREVVEAIRKEISQLPEKQRKVVKRIMEKCTYAEIAEDIFGVATATTISRVFNLFKTARRALKTRLRSVST